MTNKAAAKRFGAVVFFVRLSHRAEVLDPILVLIEPIRVIDDVAHLMPQVAQDVPRTQSFDIAGAPEVQRRQIRTREIKRDGNTYGTERYAPFGRKVKPGPEASDVRPLQLGFKLFENRF